MLAMATLPVAGVDRLAAAARTGDPDVAEHQLVALRDLLLMRAGGLGGRVILGRVRLRRQGRSRGARGAALSPGRAASSLGHARIDHAELGARDLDSVQQPSAAADALAAE